MLKRLDIEQMILGSCLVHRANLTVVSSYISQKNFSDTKHQHLYAWMLQNPDPFVSGGIELYKDLKKITGLSAIELGRLITRGTAFQPLIRLCLLLLEFTFREMAIHILKKNRETVLVPLAPVERDIANPDNEVWRIITQAANYCSDCGLDDLAAELTELLQLMDQKARSIQQLTQYNSLKKAIEHIENQNPTLIHAA